VARTAVIVIGGAPVDPRVLAHLPKDRVVVAADSGFDRAVGLGLAVDLLVGDLDSVSRAGLAAAAAAGTSVERHPADKDATDTELAIEAAVRLGCTRLVGVSGGPCADARAPGETRLDHELGAILAFSRPGIIAERVELWWGQAHLRVLHGPDRVDLAIPVGDLVSLLPLHGSAAGISTAGLRYPLRDETLAPGTSRGVSNEVVATPASVGLARGTVLIVRPLALGGPPCSDD
jgi:thiamine pyrophosphokinase